MWNDGTSGNHFLIYDKRSLAALANETNTNESKFGFHGKYIRLMNDLNLNWVSWTTIGNTTGEVSDTSNKNPKGVFKGTYSPRWSR